MDDNHHLTVQDEVWQTTATILLFGDIHCAKDISRFNPKQITFAEYSKLPLKKQVYNFAYARLIEQDADMENIINQLPKEQQQIGLMSSEVVSRFHHIFGNVEPVEPVH